MICRRQNCTLLLKALLYKSAYCVAVNYAKTVDERNLNCSTDIWEGRVKVVSRRHTTQTPSSVDILWYNDAGSPLNVADSVRLSTRRRYWLGPLTTQLRHRIVVSRADSVRLPMPSWGTKHWRHNFYTVPVCLVAVTACRRSVAILLSSRRWVHRSRRPGEVRDAACLLRCWLHCY